MLLSLFSTSLFSLRPSTLCDPFPIAFIKDDQKDYRSLQTFAEALPDVEHLSKPNSLANLPSQMLSMVGWVVDSVCTDGFSFKKISLEQYKNETAGVDSKQSKFSDPNHIFKVEYEEDHPSLEQWKEQKEKHGVTLGFHGSAFENFHSILRNGLDNFFRKETSLFGEGIYLSEDRDVAFSFLKFGRNSYKNTKFGDQVGCIVCGEVIKNPKHVRLSDEKKENSGGIHISEKSKLPKGYIVVENNKYVQIRYLLVYENFVSKTKKRNICEMVALVYAVLLIILIVLSNTSFLKYYLRYLD
uniref:Poly [ADP-ribose] polymerase n=1 Tax=Arcella intermedia TaxID=1963864 RepID=A0A6B2LAY4_9EUKA